MGKAFIIALSAPFLIWVAAILFSSTGLISRNWKLFRTWRQQGRRTRLKLALWAAVPLLMAGLLWMRSVAVINYILVPQCCPTFSIIQIAIYMPLILVSLALTLWWVCDMHFSGEEAAADQMWRWLMYLGLGAAAVTLALSWWWL